MKKYILIGLTILVLVACKIKEDRIEEDLEALHQDTEKLGQALDLLDEARVNKLKSETNDLSLEISDIRMSSNSQDRIYMGIKNNLEINDIYKITSQCTRDVVLLASKTISIGAGQVEIFEMDIDTNEVASGIYKCNIYAKSDAGQEYIKSLFITVE
ncbi:hypothetical protein JW930_07010 [Candidatus Woesearchaeota archaeon]|nr:hypothetical protein [Candidatus Woesearchaeota archaeon]